MMGGMMMQERRLEQAEFAAEMRGDYIGAAIMEERREECYFAEDAMLANQEFACEMQGDYFDAAIIQEERNDIAFDNACDQMAFDDGMCW